MASGDVISRCKALSLQKSESLSHEGLVILEDATMSGILIEDEFGIWQATRQIDGVLAGHHFVLVAIGNQNWLLDCTKILWRLRAPSLDCLELPEEGAHRDRLIAIRLALCQPSRKSFAAWRPFAVEVKKR